jgi:hypothetical protein
MVRLAGLLLVLILLPFSAFAEKRVALLIGNEAYGSEIGRLANPHNDVALPLRCNNCEAETGANLCAPRRTAAVATRR